MEYIKKYNKKFEYDYEKYIVPYYQKVNFNITSSNKDESYALWHKTFITGHTSLKSHKNVEWFDNTNYITGRGWKKRKVEKFLSHCDMDLIRALNSNESLCTRRAKQLIQLSCDLYKNPVQVYPVVISGSGLHPGNTLCHALKILKKGVKAIHIEYANRKNVIHARTIQTFDSIDAIQKIYDNPISAFFIAKDPTTRSGLQILKCWNGFSTFDKNGNLEWETDMYFWPINTFLKKLSNCTRMLDGEIVKVKGNGRKFSIRIPFDKKIKDKIWQDMFKWGYYNIIN